MNNSENEVFEFGTNPNEEANNFNYENISGLGESNYENEDLFDNLPPVNTNNENTTSNNEPVNNWDINSYSYDLSSDPNLANIPTFETPAVTAPMQEVVTAPQDIFNSEYVENSPIRPIEEQPVVEEKPVDTEAQTFIDNFTNGEVIDIPEYNQGVEIFGINEPQPVEQPQVEQKEEQPSVIPEMQAVETLQEITEPEELKTIEDTTVPVEDNTVYEIPQEENPNNMMPEMSTVETEAQPEESEVVEEEAPTIEMSETPIEDLQRLTEYQDEKIDSTDINSLFDTLSLNVKDASEIFRKNTNLKEKIDTRFEELKSLQGELANSRKKQMEEIDKYRDEVLDKLTEKKNEIERRLNILKELQATLEKEKTEFEEYKRKEQANISKVQKEVQAAYDERREELEHIEDVLRKQKDSLDEERNQLSLDKIQYESDKNELANNLLKFNQIVNSFTNGIEMKPEKEEE